MAYAARGYTVILCRKSRESKKTYLIHMRINNEQEITFAIFAGAVSNENKLKICQHKLIRMTWPRTRFE